MRDASEIVTVPNPEEEWLAIRAAVSRRSGLPHPAVSAGRVERERFRAGVLVNPLPPLSGPLCVRLAAVGPTRVEDRQGHDTGADSNVCPGFGRTVELGPGLAPCVAATAGESDAKSTNQNHSEEPLLHWKVPSR